MEAVMEEIGGKSFQKLRKRVATADYIQPQPQLDTTRLRIYMFISRERNQSLIGLMVGSKAMRPDHDVVYRVWHCG